jgi:hypothetical protein
VTAADDRGDEATAGAAARNARHSLEEDLERAQAIAERGLILRTTVGSVVHGLSNPGTDDRDEMGVCVEPPEYLLGFRRFGHFVYRTQPEGAPSGPGDLDLVIYGLRRYCRLALKGSPTVLLPLFVAGEHVVARTELGAELQALAPAFVSRAAGRGFLGYLGDQRRRLTGERHATRTRELSREHGYDTKYAMHAARLGFQCAELLATGRLSLPILGEPADWLRDVRRGDVPFGDWWDRCLELDAYLAGSELDESIRPRPDEARIVEWSIAAHLSAWGAL